MCFRRFSTAYALCAVAPHCFLFACLLFMAFDWRRQCAKALSVSALPVIVWLCKSLSFSCSLLCSVCFCLFFSMSSTDCVLYMSFADGMEPCSTVFVYACSRGFWCPFGFCRIIVCLACGMNKISRQCVRWGISKLVRNEFVFIVGHM